MAQNTDQLSNDFEETSEQDLIDELSARLSTVSQAEELDPKFDAALSSFDEASYDEIAPVPLSSDKELDTQSVIDVMDHFLCCEATWLGGADSEKTLFSCIYFRDLTRLSSHAILHPFFGVARMIYHAASSVLSFEKLENDEEFSDGVSLQRLQVVEEKISRQLMAYNGTLFSKEGLPEGTLDTSLDLEEQFCNAVLCRLSFHKYFYHMLTCLRKTQGDGGLGLGKKHIASCLSELDSILETCAVSKARVEHKKTTASGLQPLGFDYQLRRYTVELRGWKEAIEYFRKLLHDLKIICSRSLTPVLEDSFSFMVEFNKYRPLPFARASVQMLVQDGRLYGREPIFGIIWKAALLPEWANDHDILKLKSVEELGKLLIELLRVLCTDFEYQRGELASKILDWRRILLQLDTEFRDKYGNPKRFLSAQDKINRHVYNHIRLWVEEQRYWIALRYLLLGFDTDAYFPNDYFMVYWYIHVITMHFVWKIMEKGQLNVSVYNIDEESTHIMLLRCYSYVVDGLTAILGVLRIKHKLFIWPSGEQVSEEEVSFSPEYVLFEQYVNEAARALIVQFLFQRFNLISSELLADYSYEFFKKSTSPSYFSEDVLATHNSFDEAHKIIFQLRVKCGHDEGRLNEVTQLMNVTVRNQKAFNFLRQLDTLDESTMLSFSFDQHPHFAVATICDPDIQDLQSLNINAP